MTKPAVVLIGESPWVEVVSQRVSAMYRSTVYRERENYVARLADDNAAMILVDGQAGDWRFWAITPKTSPATRRIPVVVVADDEELHEQARLAGADLALTPAEMVAQLPNLLTEMGRVVDTTRVEAMARQCDEPMPADGLEAIAQFNRGEYYRQHDLFEAMWMAEEGPVRDLYRAILQVGIAYYQITRQNGRGAYKMLLRSIQWLALLPDVCQGVDVARLKADAAAVREALERLGMDDISGFDQSLLKPVRLVEVNDAND